MILNRAVSLADQVFERLEGDILTGKYPRGTVLTELKMCEDLGVSRTPVREAIRRLEQEHIIENTGKGIVVLSITDEDADVIYTIRKRIEGLAAAECARNATEEQVSELRSIVELQEFYASKHDSERVKSLDSEFHEKVYRYSGSIVYYDTLSPLHKKIQKVRDNSLRTGSRAEQATLEHRKILDAIANHDAVSAEMMMYEHVCNAHRNLSKRLAQKRMEDENESN